MISVKLVHAYIQWSRSPTRKMGAQRRSSSELLATLATFICILLQCIGTIDAVHELTPPYFNLAEGRKIYATSTCGEDVDEPELYCKLVGANTENDNHLFSVIQGQVRNMGKYNSSEFHKFLLSSKIMLKIFISNEKFISYSQNGLSR